MVGSLIVGKGTKATLPAFTQSTIFESFSDITKSSYHWCCGYIINVSHSNIESD